MKHLLTPYLIFGVFLLAMAIEKDWFFEKDTQPTPARQATDLVIEPDKSKDGTGDVKKAWDDLLDTMYDVLMEDIEAIDDVLMQGFGLKKKDE